MSEEFSERRRRFVRLTEQELARLERWQLPEVGQCPTAEQLGEQLGYRLPPATAVPEAEAPREPEAMPITAAELEAIRQAAYEEGLQQGLDEGRERGHAEGLQQGLDEGREQGHVEGLAQGYQAGMSQAEESLAEQRRQLTALHDNLVQPASRLDEQLLTELRELACLLAEAILYREVETSQTLILDLLKRGLDTLPSLHQAIKVFVHPEDRLLLEACWAEPEQDIQLVLINDSQQSRGNCRLVTETSQVEFNWQQRFAEQKAQLLAAPVEAPAAASHPSTEEPADHALGSQPVDSLPAQPAQ